MDTLLDLGDVIENRVLELAQLRKDFFNLKIVIVGVGSGCSRG